MGLWEKMLHWRDRSRFDPVWLVPWTVQSFLWLNCRFMMISIFFFFFFLFCAVLVLVTCVERDDVVQWAVWNRTRWHFENHLLNWQTSYLSFTAHCPMRSTGRGVTSAFYRPTNTLHPLPVALCLTSPFSAFKSHGGVSMILGGAKCWKYWGFSEAHFITKAYESFADSMYHSPFSF